MSPLEADLERCAEALARPAGVVLYPTETVYGLGGRASDGAAALRVSQIKGREHGPLIVLVDETPAGLPPLADAIAGRFWPGPVTLIVPAEGLNLLLAPEVLAPQGTVALRWSGHPVVQALIQRVGPLTSSSANRHGEPPPRDLAGCALSADASVDVGPLPPASPSTLVHGVTGQVLRAGALAEQVGGWLADRQSGA